MQLGLSLARWENEGQWHGYAYSIARNYARLEDRNNAFRVGSGVQSAFGTVDLDTYLNFTSIISAQTYVTMIYYSALGCR